MIIQWEKVYVFISSTFNDMHAERDYLIKQVFPELREWCDKRKLRLVDIDLRWGVTEQDALYNKNVVKVCLDRIDDCRPFFLCFLGQRRGWVPAESDISESTFESFPDLKAFAGKASVTEIEILHALVNPLHRSKQRDPKQPAEFYDPVKHAFFYLRDDTYLGKLPNDPPQLRQTYTNESINDEAERGTNDEELARWRNVEIPQSSRPFHHYQGHWDARLTTPELLFPLQCPSTETVSLERWRKQWKQAKVTANGTDIEVDPTQAEKAREFNRLLSTGRLTDFRVEEKALSRVIVTELQKAIAVRFPDHIEVSDETDLQKEMDQQEQFLFVSSEGFIRREGDFEALDAYVEGDSNQLFALTAPGGIGKSTLLANWIEHYRSRNADKRDQSIHFRFVGQSDRSTTTYSLLQFLLREMKEVSGKFTEEIPDDPQKLRQELLKLLAAAGRKGKTVIVLDALNQLESGLSDLSWLPYQLPKNVKLIISFKRGASAAEELYQHMQGQVILYDVRPFVDLDDRRKLVRAYLSQYLKDLDERHLETLIQSAGAENPLFLKVALSELRVFGAFANLGEKIRSDFGETPVSAFQGVLKRLENDPAYSPIDPKQAVPLLFGLLAHTRQGLSAEELTGLFIQVLGKQDNKLSQQAASDSVYLYLRQVRPFLAYRDGSYDFFFESFKLAALEHFTGGQALRRETKAWHGLLANYLAGRALTSKKDGIPSPNLRKLSELPYHQAMAGDGKALTDTLVSFPFMHLSLSAFGPYTFIDQFKLLEIPSLEITAADREALMLLRDALELSSHILVRDSAQLPAQLIGRLHSFQAPRVQKLLEAAAESWGNSPHLRPIKVQFTAPGGGLSFTMKGDIGGASLYITPRSDRVVTVSGAAFGGRPVTLWDIGKRALLRRFDQISEAVVTPDARTATLFTQGSDKVGLRVVNLQDLSEKGTMSGKSSKINAKAITPDGRYAISASRWGTAIKAWNLKTGREQSSFITSRVDNWILVERGRLLSRGVTTFSPKPDSFILESTPESLDLWDITTGERIFDLSQQHNAIWGNNMIASPGGRFAISKSFQCLNIWDLEKGEEIRKINGSDDFKAMATTPDGKTLLFSEKGLLRFMSLDDGKEIQTVNCDAMQLIPTRDGKRVVSCSVSGDIEVWDIGKGKRLSAFKSPEDILSLLLSPDEEKVILHVKPVAGENRMSVKGVEVKTGKELFKMDGGYIGSPIAFTPDGRLGVTVIPIEVGGSQAGGTFDAVGEFALWDLEKGRLLSSMSGKRTQGVDTLAISPDGRQVIAGSKWTSHLTAWEVGSGEAVQSYPLGDLSGVNKVAVSSDGEWVVSESDNYLLKVWDLLGSRELHSVFTHNIHELISSPDGRRAIASSMDGKLQIWDLPAGKELYSLSTPRDSRVAVSEDGRRLIAIARQDEEIRVWDFQNGKLLKTIPKISWEAISAFGLDPSGRYLVSDQYREKLVQIDLEDDAKATEITDELGLLGKLTVIPLYGSPNPAQTPDGEILVTRGEREPLSLWDLHSGKRKNTLTTDDYIQSFAISPDGKKLVTSSTTALQVWDLERLGSEPPSQAPTKKESPVAKVAFSADGTIAVSAAKDGTIKVWAVGGGKELYTFDIQVEPQTILFSPDGKRLISCCAAYLKVWSLEGGEEILSISKTGKDAVTPDGQYALISKGGGNLELWNLEAKVKINTFQDEAGKGDYFGVDMMKITSDGKRAITTVRNTDAQKYSLAIWDLSRGTRIQTRGFEHWVETIHLSSDEKKAVTTFSCPLEIRVWDLTKGKEIRSLADRDSESCKVLSGERLLTFPEVNNQPSKTKLWDLKSGRHVATVDNGLRLAAVFPDKQKAVFAAGGYLDRVDRVWGNTLSIRELDHLSELLRLEGAWKDVPKVVVTPDARFAIALQSQWDYEKDASESTSEADWRVFRVWDLSDGRILASLFMDSGISQFAVSPDGRTVAAGDVLGQVHFLRLDGVAI